MSFVRTTVAHPEKGRAFHVSVPSHASACCGRCDRCFCWWLLGSFERSTPVKVLCVLLSLDSHSSCLDYIFHDEQCHISLWQKSTDNFWHPRDPDDHFLSSLKNTEQILIAPQGMRWAPTYAHLRPGRTTYSTRSNQWSNGSRLCPIQPATISQLHHWRMFSSWVQS
jgi:hypothetical protein